VDIFRTLEVAMGAQHWWPAGSAFEVVVGAYLTQNTAWTNVDLAMGNLRRAGVLSISGIRSTSLEELEQLVRPAGYFQQKAARLKRFVAHLDASYGGSLEEMFGRPLAALREELLGLPGIGPETADSILLYAASREVFVVDSYTRRIFERHELVSADADYDEIRLEVEKALSGDVTTTPAQDDAGTTPQVTGDAGVGDVRDEDVRGVAGAPIAHAPSVASAMERSELSRRYNEFHALIVQTAKHYCVKGEPRCEKCPLRTLLPPGHRYR
jgi:endonuclease-3 related protein